jgi:hypothetical protein
MENYSVKARRAEKEGKWWEAVSHWKREGGEYGMIEAGVCQTIAEASRTLGEPRIKQCTTL